MNTKDEQPATAPPGLLRRMVRRRSMCEECPFRPPVENAIEIEGLLDADFSCHTEDGPGGYESGIQCRGHWEAVRKHRQKFRPKTEMRHGGENP